MDADPVQATPATAPEALLTTRLAAPLVRANLVVRRRLTALLDESLQQGCRLFLISAPAGSGKTALISQWLLEAQSAEPTVQGERNSGVVPECWPAPARERVAWLSLDAGDNDPQRFCAYLLAALRRVSPQVGAATASLLGGPGLPGIESLMVPLLNDLAALPDPIFLVLDDYHLITAPAIHDALALLVERQPPALRLLLLTRADPPLPLARLRARGQLAEVRLGDLRFTPEEAAAFFRHTLPTPLDDLALRTLHAQAEGWGAGLQLAALSLRGRSAEECAAAVRRFGGSSQYVLDYLVDEVLRQQPPHRKAFLLQTSILDQLCGPLCDAVLGMADTAEPAGQQRPAPSYSQRILDELDHANLFLVPLDREGRWYRYHQLFAEALRVQLDAEPELRGLLHHRAAAWLAQHGLWEAGVRHALSAGDSAFAGRLIAQAGDSLIARGEMQTLRAWLEAVPEAVVHADARLLILHAWAAYACGQVERSLGLLELLAAIPAAQLDRRTRGRILCLQALAANGAEAPETAPLAREALALIEDDDLFRQVALLSLGHGQRRAGATRAAGETYAAAIAVGRARQAPYVTMNLINSLAVNLNDQGRRPEALRLVDATRAAWSDGQGRPLPILDLLAVSEGVLAYEGNALEIAREHAEHGWEAIRQWLSGRIVGVDTELVAVLASAGLGDFEAAWRRIDAARAVGSTLRWFGPVVDALEAELWLRQGDVAAAARWAEAAGLSSDAEPNAMREYELLTYSRMLLAEGRHDAAERLLARLATALEAGPRLARLISVRLLQARAAEQRGGTAESRRRLGEALALAEPGGYIRRFLDEGPEVEALLRQHGAQVAQSERQRRLVGQLQEAFDGAPGAFAAPERGEAPPGPARPALPLAEPLSAQELAVLRLLAAGCSNQAIADALVITLGTAKWHVHNLYGKLGVSGRLQAVARARELALLEG
ncbi:MAG TPA: LuxR C-terminal-related transcriptional regulator [Chloroflexaceae bacterium]|nr:LuxR C-terminal-related transcriptional regulator [Chloroflexaceae bacterium]